MRDGRFFIDISGCLCSFGLASFVVQEYVVVLQWIAAGSSGKSLGQRLGSVKVTGMHAIMMDFCIWGRLTRPRGSSRAQGSALTRNVERSHGSKNLLQRGILYRHEKILLRQGRSKTAWKFGNLERGNISPGRDRWEVELQRLSGRLWRLVD